MSSSGWLHLGAVMLLFCCGVIFLLRPTIFRERKNGGAPENSYVFGQGGDSHNHSTHGHGSSD